MTLNTIYTYIYIFCSWYLCSILSRPISRYRPTNNIYIRRLFAIFASNRRTFYGLFWLSHSFSLPSLLLENCHHFSCDKNYAAMFSSDWLRLCGCVYVFFWLLAVVLVVISFYLLSVALFILINMSFFQQQRFRASRSNVEMPKVVKSYLRIDFINIYNKRNSFVLHFLAHC